MNEISDLLALVDRDLSADTVLCKTHPQMDYMPDMLLSVGSMLEKKRLSLIETLIEKRKYIRDVTVKSIEELIVYCDNKILEIGTDYDFKADRELQKLASIWQQTKINLMQTQIGEHKELFRDTLFLRNEWVKSLLSYMEEESLDSILKKLT